MHQYWEKLKSEPTPEINKVNHKTFESYLWTLLATKDSDNKAIRSKDKRERKKNNSINNNEIRTFGESKNQNNNKFNSRRRNKKW